VQTSQVSSAEFGKHTLTIEGTDADGGTASLHDIGIWVKLRTPETVEIAANAGFSFFIVDLEHSPLGLDSAADYIALGSALGMTALARVPTPDSPAIGPLLDAGADGIVVAHVDTALDASAAFAAMRFPPHGRRGSGSTGHAGRWGTASRASYLSPAHGQPKCIVQIESPEALANLESILSTEIDAILIGPADLRLSTGESADELRSSMLSAMRKAKSLGVPCGTAVSGASAAADALSQGFDFVAAGADTSLLASAAITLVNEAKSRLGDSS
jgi:4-hydroxy-2-oxoheptanedioate aldolase